MQLRDYQTDAVINTLHAWDEGVKRPAVVLPTGAGKTVCFAKLCHVVSSRGGQPLILVNRDELVRQTVAKLRAVAPGLSIGVVQAERNELNRNLTVASIQTLSRQARLDKIPPGRFTHIIADECHYAAAPSWRRVLDHFDVPTVGFTATMTRADNKGLGEIWQTIVFERDTRWAIEQGFLVPVEARMVTLDDLDLAKVKTSKGDFADGDLGRAMAQAGAGPLIAKAYLEHCRDDAGELRRGICFTPTIELATSFLEDFRSAGIPTELVIGSTPTSERQARYAATALGTNKVLMSVGVLTTGFDLPAVEVAVIARPTKAKGLFIQMCGRAMRLCPETGKESCLILDVVGSTRLGLAGVVDLGLDKIKLDGVVTDLMPSGGIVAVEIPEVPEDIRFTIIDPFTGLRVPDPHAAVRKKIMRRARQQAQWSSTDGGTPFLAPCNGYEYWTFLHPEGDGWTVGRMPQKAGRAERLTGSRPFPEAMWFAMESHPTATDLAGVMTEGQERFLQQLRIPVVPGMAKAEASRLINQKLGTKRLD